MINKKKIHFYQLTFIFAALIIGTLLYNWGYAGSLTKSEGMMSGSMGKMMSSMNLKNINLSDLFKAESDNKANSSSASHHEEASSYKKDIYYITTSTIVILTPFIVAGSVFLAIVWIK